MIIKKLLIIAILGCTGLFAQAQTWEELNTEVLDFLNTGDYQSALSSAIKAKDLAETQFGLEHPDYSASLHNLASSYKKLGHYEKAESLYWDALKIDKQVLGVKHQNYALSLFGLANLYKLKKDFSKAEAIYYDALDIMKRAVTDRHPDYSLILSDYGDLFTALKSYDKAESHLRRAREITKNSVGENHHDYGSVLFNLAKLYKAKGDKSKAESSMKDAMKIYQVAVGETHPNYLDCKRFLENIDNPTFQLEPEEIIEMVDRLVVSNIETPKTEMEIETVESVVEEVPNISNEQKEVSIPNMNSKPKGEMNSPKVEMPKIENKPVIKEEPKLEPVPVPKKRTWNDFSSMMDDYAKAGDYDQAISVGEKALMMVKEEFGEDHENYSWVSLKMAANYMNNGMPEKAIPIYEKDLAVIEGKMGTNNQTYKARFNELMDLYRSNGMSEKADAFATKKLFASLSNLSSSSSSDKINILRNLENQISEFSSNAMTNNSPTIGNDLQGINLVLKGASIDSDLGIESKSTGELSNVFNRLQEKLGINEAVVDFMQVKNSNTGSTNYYALVTRFRGDKTIAVPLAEDYKLQSILNVKASSSNSYVQNTETSKKLFQMIWEPIEEHLKGINVVSISATGILNQVAFNSLIDDRGSMLVEKYNFHFYNSVQDFILNNEEIPSNKKITFFGGAEFGTNGAVNYMPSTKDEVNTFKVICAAKGWAVETFTGSEATEGKAKMKEGNDAAGILHLATPVYLDAENSRVGMALNNANNAISSGTVSSFADDGMLTGKEIASMDLTKTGLVVLSATDADSGDGMLAIQKAFKAAGANAVLVSQWKTPDKQTQELLTLFYINHLSGMSAHKALSTAQKEIRKLYKSPYYWASFMIIE